MVETPMDDPYLECMGCGWAPTPHTPEGYLKMRPDYQNLAGSERMAGEDYLEVLICEACWELIDNTRDRSQPKLAMAVNLIRQDIWRLEAKLDRVEKVR